MYLSLASRGVYSNSQGLQEFSIGFKLKIAVIMPWAGEDFEIFKFAIESINQQILQANEKILVVAKPDLILDKQITNILRGWKVIRPGKKCLPGESRNIGIANLSSDISHIMLMDADDISHPNRLSALSKPFQNGFNGVAGSQAVIFSGLTLFGRFLFCGYPKMPLSRGKIEEELGKNRVPIVMSSIMFDRKILQSVKGYPENLARGEDLEFIKDIVANHHKVMNIQEVLYAYRRKPLQKFSGYLEDVMARGVHNFLWIRYLLHIWKRVFFIIIGIPVSIKWWGIEQKLAKYLIDTGDE